MLLSCHVCEFQSEATLYSCLNVKELLARNRSHIWSLRDTNEIRTHNHLVRKRTLDHLANLFEEMFILPKNILQSPLIYDLSKRMFHKPSYRYLQEIRQNFHLLQVTILDIGQDIQEWAK